MAWDDIASGAGTGASLGGTLGSVVPGIGTALGALGGGLLGGAAGGFFGRNKSQETKIQEQQRQLVDELLGSLRGNGPYSDLFTPNEGDFERSFAEPARARFRNITAPQIQQRYIANGMQNSTGLEDTLARAGVDMDQLLNEQYMNYVQGAQNRRASAIGQILNQGPGALPEQSGWDAALQGIGDYLTGPSIGKNFEDILGAFIRRNKTQNDQNISMPPRKGFEENPFYTNRNFYNSDIGFQRGGF